MSIQNPTERKDDASTDGTDDTCGCTPLMPCFDHYRDGDRGRPAIRRRTEDA